MAGVFHALVTLLYSSSIGNWSSWYGADNCIGRERKRSCSKGWLGWSRAVCTGYMERCMESSFHFGRVIYRWDGIKKKILYASFYPQESGFFVKGVFIPFCSQPV